MPQGSTAVTVIPEKYQQTTYAWDQINVYTRVNKSRFSFGKSEPKERKHILKDGESMFLPYALPIVTTHCFRKLLRTHKTCTTFTFLTSRRGF